MAIESKCLPCREICDCLTFTSDEGTIIIDKQNCTVHLDINPEIMGGGAYIPTLVDNGVGIQVTGDGSQSTPYIVSNTGVLTVNGQSGNVNIAAANGSETKVVAGTNITVTGQGTIASPYVINSTSTNGAVYDGSETKVDDGVGILVTGLGTIASPYIVSNTGVTSVNGQTGAVTVTQTPTYVNAGTNITVTGTGTFANPFVISATASASTCAITVQPFASAGAQCCKSLDAALNFHGGIKRTNNSGTCQQDIKIDDWYACNVSWEPNFTALVGGNDVGAQFVYKNNIIAKFRGTVRWQATPSTTYVDMCSVLSTVNGSPCVTGSGQVPYPTGQSRREFYTHGGRGGSLYHFVVRYDSAGNFEIRAAESGYPQGEYLINLEPVIFETS
jgi:hypothetical protein